MNISGVVSNSPNQDPRCSSPLSGEVDLSKTYNVGPRCSGSTKLDQKKSQKLIDFDFHQLLHYHGGQDVGQENLI